MEGCKCKVVSCPMCGSSCKRCACACDGIDPKMALNRARGQRGPQKLSTIVLEVCWKKEKQLNGPELSFQWQLLRKADWNKHQNKCKLRMMYGKRLPARKNKLPSEHSRMNDTPLATHDGSRTGWNTMVYSGYSAAVRVAEILYPANSDSLLADVSIKLRQNSCSTCTTKDDNKILDTMIMIMNSSKKRSIQGRVARAILVNGIPAWF